MNLNKYVKEHVDPKRITVIFVPFDGKYMHVHCDTPDEACHIFTNADWDGMYLLYHTGDLVGSGPTG